ncbi:acetate--CoA ligase [Actinomycetospora sp. NBRC 106378]|uniref:acetate--CoA ligase n=1 Tax=Actinomycetospora sp. NBRC 106378 TaxID=3032208 RepID=UPI0024A3A69A|nr:acetate--CoA ligase [Actinomycetospora sp. NBRC 106378]GLZ54529.1 acetyl-coenzyme A synthetase [Actinomycetospora sp. NBRC 106378]
MSEQGSSQGNTYPPDPELSKTANVRPEMKDMDLEEFWDSQAKERISWFEPYDTVLDWQLPYAKWFVGGKLNACYNAVDRHVENGQGDKVALHVVPDDGLDSPDAHDITFAQLQEQVVRFAHGLKKVGVGKGVPVGIYMQMIPEAVVAMLACARLGAPHTVVFGGFSGKAVAERCNDLECKVLITQDEALRGGKTAGQKTNADEGLDGAGSTTVEKVVVVKRTGGDVPMTDRDVYLDDLIDGESSDAESCPCEPMESEDLLFLLYTSGSTGKPKGVVHTTGGYLTGVATTHNLVFDVKDDSVYWCAADIGWITGHSYITYGPLVNGVTSVLYEGVPGYPDKEVWWKIVEKYKVSILYTSPTAIRSHMKWGEQHAQAHDLSSIKILGSVGEPINPEVWEWYRKYVGNDKAPIMDTWWQTETGHILITPLPGITTMKPGSAQQPFPGVRPEIRDDEGNVLGVEQTGNLVLTAPWPGMMRGLYKDDQRFRDTYWSKYSDAYFAGDGAKYDEDGDIMLMGRLDDVVNVSGHRLSTFEIESALVEHGDVAEAAVAARKDPDTGQAIVAFVSLTGDKEGTEELEQALREQVAQSIGKLARPATVIFAPDLPKTRSGKIMRRLLKNLAEGEELGDTSTLVDPSVVEDMKKQIST